jgi:hypothetical protein
MLIEIKTQKQPTTIFLSGTFADLNRKRKVIFIFLLLAFVYPTTLTSPILIGLISKNITSKKTDQL